MESKMKIIVCFCTRRKLEDSEFLTPFQTLFIANVNRADMVVFLLFLERNTPILNVFLLGSIMFLIANVSNLDRLNIVKAVVK